MPNTRKSNHSSRDLKKHSGSRHSQVSASGSRASEQGDLGVSLLTRDNSYDVPKDIVGGLSTYWDYAFRQRNRWLDSAPAFRELGDRASKSFETLGIFRESLIEIGKSGVVEVHIPFTREESGWGARILPWEFLLRASTGNLKLVVIRHLDKSPSPAHPEPKAPSRLLFVESAPGKLGQLYNFKTEQWLAERSLSLENHELENPTSQQLEDEISAWKPNIIHLAGIDLHEGDQFLDYGGPNKEWDGYYLRGESLEDQRVDAKRLGLILNPEGFDGALVSCNFYNSAARVAALAVAKGAIAAIGFQDVVDDALAERFFGNLYQNLRANNWLLLPAFEDAWLEVAAGKGAGIVFWSRNSLIRAPQAPSREAPKPEVLEIGVDTNQAIQILVEPNTTINYGLLHNGKGLFRRFRIYKSEPKYANGIQVHVSLNMGTGSFPYEATFNLGAHDSLLDVAERMNLPLTSELARSIRESIQTTLQIRVRYAGQELHHETLRVTLLPVNEWEFSRDWGARFLASFILPGDPAIRKIVDAAQKYLMALCDDNGQGFDGYQSTNSSNEDPDEGLDLQVRALWCALSFEYGLNYINPPPVFTKGSQRLRTPSDVIAGHRGTCIDLALLFVACLEYVDIYPVIFVLSNHAFAGYWRNEKAYEEFLNMKKAPDRSGSTEGGIQDVETQRSLAFEEMRQCVRDGSLIPLETVWITLHRGFSEAVQAGMDNLRSSHNFAALLNVKKLRQENVTPLPICGQLA